MSSTTLSNNNNDILHKKGSIIHSQTPFFVVSFPQQEHDDDECLQRRLPRYPAISKEGHSWNLSPKSLQLVQQHSNMMDSLSLQAVVMCLELLWMRQKDESTTTSNVHTDNDSTAIRTSEEEEDELLLEAYTLVQHCITTWKEWICLYEQVKKNLRVLQVPRVEQDYVTRTVFSLTDKELEQACALVESGNCSSFLPRNKHALSQALLEMPPKTLLALCQSPFFTSSTTTLLQPTVQHSCVPNVVLEYNSQHHSLQYIALYDVKQEEELCESVVDTTLSTPQRLASLQERYGTNYTCICIKCTVDNDEASLSLSLTDMKRLGHAALVHECFDEARQWYRKVLETFPNNGDIYHALGATYLQQGHFLKAQCVWKDAATKLLGNNNLKHDGIALQLEKQAAYHYFDRQNKSVGENNDSTTTIPSYTDVFDSGLCFVTDTPTLSKQECNQVMAWAEASQWTTSRHYAVPTHDVPVHTVPLLLTWFTDWMNSTMRPLLAQQFQLFPQHFHVHDAFVVKYTAPCGDNDNTATTTTSNYLPMHFDESTHSLVLVLNNEFQGGGTYFLPQNTVVNPKQPGSVVSFRGDVLQHGGQEVTKGVRYILAVFMYYDDDSDVGVEENENTTTSCSSGANERKRRRGDGWNASKERSFSFGFDV